MTSDIEQAKKLLKSGGYTLVLCKENEVYTSNLRGVKPLLEFLNRKHTLNGFCAADKTVGAGAAYLYAALGIKCVWAHIMSESAKKVLEYNGICALFDKLVPKILNRAGDGICPMEKAVKNASSVEDAVYKIKKECAKMKIKVEENKNPSVKPDPETLGFGRVFTDHMFIMDYSADKGWHDARIVPFSNIELHPAATVLHYGSEIFEGLKAYRRADGQVQLFRPIENIRRMNRSAERMCLPQIPEEDFFGILTAFVEHERDWTPYAEGTSLYIRPFMFGNDESLGVHSVKNATFMIIASPVGSYYKEGINPVKIMIESEDVRAVRGGTGEAKCGGNYAASNRAGEKAEEKGYSQVLWLDGVERRYIEEVGAMNVMFKIDGKVVTPMLAGSILPGITRKSCIQLLKDSGYEVEERRISLDELEEALESGKLEEAWGCGTAAVISPIGELAYNDKKFVVNNGEIGKVSHFLYDTLTGIQWGKIQDKYGWTVQI